MIKNAGLVAIALVLLSACAHGGQLSGAAQSGNRLGIMGFPYSHAAADPDARAKADDFMDLYLLTGSRWDRRDLWWSVVEPARGEWQWDHVDAAIQDFREAGVQPVVILCYGSAWKGDAPATEDEFQAFGEYTFRMVERYKGSVKHWEVWNEPNILPFWAPKPNAAHYARLLQVAYQRAKEADPECVVLGGALAGADERFLRAVYAHGGRGHFDALSYHTYGNNPTETNIRREIDILRAVMREHDDLKPLWITETGIYTGPAGVDEATQAERIVRSSVLWLSHGVERIFQLTLKDWTADADAVDATAFRGLLRANRTPKPAFWAHRLLSEQVGTADYRGRWSPAPGIEGFLFSNEDHDVLVLWGEEERAAPWPALPLDSAAVVEHRLSPAGDGVITRLVKGSPYSRQDPAGSFVILEGTGPALRELVNYSMKRADGEHLGALDAVPGEARDFPVQTGGWNPALRFDEGAPIAWGRDRWMVRILGDTPPGPQDVAGVVRIGEVDYPVNYRIQVEAAVRAEFLPVSRTEVPTGGLELRVENRSTTPLEATVLSKSDGVPSGQRQGMSLGARHTESVRLPVDWRTLRPGVPWSLAADVTNGRIETSSVLKMLPVMVPRTPETFVADGSLDEWAGRVATLAPEWFTEVDFNPNREGGVQDVSLRVWLGWDEEALNLAIEVSDDELVLPFSTVFWDYDSLQVAIDSLNDAREGEPFDENDYEFEVARMRDGRNWIYPGRFPEGRIPSIVEEECELAIGVDQAAGRLVYELRIPSAVIGLESFEAGRVLGFNLIHNDTDEDRPGAREGWIELTPGIGWGKEPWHYADLILWPESVPLPTP